LSSPTPCRGSTAWTTAPPSSARRRGPTEVLALLGRQLRRQREAGRRFLVGESLSAVDIYWACFSNLVVPLTPEQSPMPDYIRAAYGSWVDPPVDPLLLEHRDEVFEEFLGLPQEY
jgi:glutathione S-transferase